MAKMRSQAGVDPSRTSRRIREALSGSGLSKKTVDQIAYDLGDAQGAVIRIERAIRSLGRREAAGLRGIQEDLEELLGELVTHLPYHIGHLRRSLPKAIVTIENGRAKGGSRPARGRAKRKTKEKVRASLG